MNEAVSSCYYGYCDTIRVHASYAHAGGGIEVIGTNRSRVVPYGNIGAAYMRGTASASGYSFSVHTPAIMAGGGVRAYINRHFGIDGGFIGFRTLGSYGGEYILVPTIGVFVQSR